MSLYQIARMAFDVLQWLIIARVIISWINLSPHNSLVKFIYEFTEPILAPIRNIMPRGSIPLDFSPIIALILLHMLESLVLSLLI